MNEHTPGPWIVDEHCQQDIYNSGIDYELLATAYPMKRDGLLDSWKSNSRLIAAAPDMLEALGCAETLLILLSEEVDALRLGAPNVLLKVKAAIAKAKGRRAA